MKQFIRYLIVIGLLIATADICVATMPKIRRMLYYEFEVISFDKATGNASIAVTITPDTDTSLYVPKTVPEMCKEIPIEITSPNNLIFKTEQNMLLDFDGKENITIIVGITLVEQSQVQLLFHATCIPTGKEINNYLHLNQDENSLSISRSSLTYTKKTEPLYQKPDWDTMTTEQLAVEYEVYFQLRDEESYQFIKNYADTLIPSYKKDVYKVKLTLGEILELGKKNIEGELVHRPPWDKRTTPWKNLEDEQAKLLAHRGFQTTGPTIPLTSADSIIYNALTDMGKKGFILLKRREHDGPSTEKWGEEIWIEHECYSRDSGDTYFRKLPSFTTEEWRIESKRRKDSLRASQPPALYDVIIDLRNQEDYDYFKNRVDSLEKTERDGYYRIVCKKAVLKEVEDRKIKYRRTHRPSWIKSDTEKEELRKKPKEVKKIGMSEESLEIKSSLFFEGFESVWPGNWNAGDANSESGYDYWGDLQDWYYYSGNWAGWCSDIGDMPDGEYYDNDMYATMDMTVPVDLSQYENNRIIYQILYDTETDFDYVDRLVSTDGFSWSLQETFNGNSGGWEEINKPISFTGNYYMRFLFESDESINTDYVGAYIDDIEITGDIKTKPNLTYDWPAGWSGPIVASSVMGTNYSNTLFGDSPVYIDWAIDNDSDKDSPPFHLGLYLDNNLIGEWSYTTLWSYSSTNIQDYIQTVSSGYHTLKLVVDNRNEVAESNESDNSYEETFYWETPEITYSGHLYYQDPVPPNPGLVPMKNVRIEMWDDDGLFPDDLLGDFTTLEDGFFAIGPVDNNDQSGTLDVYFKIYAENDACYVTESYNGDIHKYETPVEDNVANGVYILDINAPLGSSGPFFIADKTKHARVTWTSLRSNNVLPKIQIRNESRNESSHYNPNDNYIHIEAGNSAPLDPNTFDTDVIYHEYGHFIQDEFNFFDTNLLGADHHEWLVWSNPYSAASEGFATFLANIFHSTSYYHEYDSNFIFSAWINSENGETNVHPFYPVFSTNNLGDGFEATITGVFWDIYDDIDDDYSTYKDVLDPNRYNPDGVWDTLTDGIGNILTTLLDRNVNGHHPDNITEFWQAWFQAPSFGHDQAMSDIWYEHGILQTCCVGMRGDINGDGGTVIDVSDLLALIGYMFQEGTISCLEEANVNCSVEVGSDAGIDISDVVYLVNYVFQRGPAPCDCP